LFDSLRGMFHRQWREQALHSLDQRFDLIIVGGGITGCGAFFDAAQRGLKVLLIEKADLASGTSSRSSKLIHGGLRYLKNMQFGVTLHSCRERDRQAALSPHLIEPLPFIFPTYEGDKTPGWMVEVGLYMYDRMTVPAHRHRRLEDAELERMAPELPKEDLDRALFYYDAMADDARLVVAVAATGFAYGGLMLTSAAAEAPIRDASGALRGLKVRDLDSGRIHEVRASLVINATGAWVDGLRSLVGLDDKTVRPSRGAHLIFDRAKLPAEAALTIPSPDDGRPVFFIPHPEGTLVGTTDHFHDGRELEDPRATREELEYLLRTTAAAFPEDPPTEDDIVGAFAGVRPTLASDATHPSEASREERIWHEEGLLSVAGGKLTTWRQTAEDVVDEAIEHLPPERGRALADCATDGTPLAGLAPADLPGRLEQAFEVHPKVASAMARRLAGLAFTACEMSSAAERRPLREDVDLSAAEVRAWVRFGAVRHLNDLLLRRARLGMWRPEQAAEVAGAVCEVVAEELSWDAGQRDVELEALDAELLAWSPRGVSELPADPAT
ncbi:MAG: glycerol-3-phosphate dehydrogenase/oxidase, partial [Acidobacteriota bacterium]